MRLPSLLGTGIIVAVFTIFIARGVITFLITPFFKYKIKESLFICFAGIKGAVPIVLATYPAANGLDENHTIFNIVFVIVIFSLLLQGTLITPILKLLKINIPALPKSEYSFELLSTVDTTIDIFEHKIEQTSYYAGKYIHETNLPESVSITSIIRNQKIIIPSGNTMIQAGDIIYILATEEQFSRLKM